MLGSEMERTSAKALAAQQTLNLLPAEIVLDLCIRCGNGGLIAAHTLKRITTLRAKTRIALEAAKVKLLKLRT